MFGTEPAKPGDDDNDRFMVDTIPVNLHHHQSSLEHGRRRVRPSRGGVPFTPQQQQQQQQQPAFDTTMMMEQRSIPYDPPIRGMSTVACNNNNNNNQQYPCICIFKREPWPVWSSRWFWMPGKLESTGLSTIAMPHETLYKRTFDPSMSNSYCGGPCIIPWDMPRCLDVTKPCEAVS